MIITACEEIVAKMLKVNFKIESWSKELKVWDVHVYVQNTGFFSNKSLQKERS